MWVPIGKSCCTFQHFHCPFRRFNRLLFLVVPQILIFNPSFFLFEIGGVPQSLALALISVRQDRDWAREKRSS
jgi:hypothetical protein